MEDRFFLNRFVQAQQPVIEDVYAQLEAGRKTSHWMWFVFPQMAGLGHSPMAKQYAIGSMAEAQAYLAHDVLGTRLRRCAQLVLQAKGRTVHDIFGAPDDMKFHSSMTLFSRVPGADPVFRQCLGAFFEGRADQGTTAILDR
jgi:uncharacterized protein (DUF1810 family)